MRGVPRWLRRMPISVETGRACRAVYMRTMVLPKVRRAGGRRTALASYPRSGNTWMRSLVEAATGEQMGSKYDDRMMSRNREGIAIKTHGLDRYAYTDAIHIIRNPFDAVWSHFNWKNTYQKPESWESFCPRAIKNWDDHTRHWLAATMPTVFVRFEDLRTEPEAELGRVLEFLGCPVDKPALASAVEACGIEKLREANKDESGQFFRAGAVGKGIEHFTDEDRAMTLRVCEESMRRVGYGEIADRA